jgi:hypothetical protein
LKRGNKERALSIFVQFAAVGYESAQFNAGFMLSQRRSIASAESLCPKVFPQPELARYMQHSRVAEINDYAQVGGQTKVSEAEISSDASVVEYMDISMAFAQSAEQFYADIAKEGSRGNNRGGGADSAESSSLLLCDARALMLFGLSASQGNGQAHQVCLIVLAIFSQLIYFVTICTNARLIFFPPPPSISLYGCATVLASWRLLLLRLCRSSSEYNCCIRALQASGSAFVQCPRSF